MNMSAKTYEMYPDRRPIDALSCGPSFLAPPGVYYFLFSFRSQHNKSIPMTNIVPAKCHLHLPTIDLLSTVRTRQPHTERIASSLRRFYSSRTIINPVMPTSIQRFITEISQVDLVEDNSSMAKFRRGLSQPSLL